SDDRTLSAQTCLLPSRADLTAPTPTISSLVPQLATNAAAPFLEGSIPSLLLQQFGVLHQQMLAQFQQCMLVMAQMFATLRPEEMELLREALERVGSLKHDVRGLAAGAKKRAARPARNNQNAAEPAGGLSDKPSIPASLERGFGVGAGIDHVGARP